MAAEVFSFQYAKLSANPTKEEIQSEIKRLETLKADFGNIDSAYKIIMNSAYGVLGFVHFIAYHRNVALTVTKQSENLIKFAIYVLDNYMGAKLFKNTALMEKIGMKPDFRPDKWDPNTSKSRHVIYADTDSLFSTYEDYYEKSDKRMAPIDFWLTIYEDDLKQHIADELEKYCIKNNAFTERPDGKVSFKLVLENICDTVLWTSKKKYVKDVIWEKGKVFKPHTNIKIKGLDANQSATPKFCREKLKELTNYIMNNSRTLDEYKLVVLIKNIKEQFKKVNVELISRTERVTDYRKYIVSDTNMLEFGSGAKPHTKGAGYYNYMLYNNKKYQNKYPFISTGTKVRWYYIRDVSGEIESFAYYADSYPEEFAPVPDYNIQFQKNFLNPLNTMLGAIGMKQIDPDLIYFSAFGW
jgi:DNA polymerase elongation subunit (family B)